ncbi:hypothetical protein WAF17_06195 [Bernardetia sp. ABR2-2B]|uniref:hypothetical protein n=1 Tax=Bernardetia sp. ABR2-2B TaxID=3127472 RepID=UPI0030CEB7EA
MTILYTIVLAIGVLMLYFLGMGVRMFFQKQGQFRGTCASQSPFLKTDDGSCSYCGKSADEVCPNN